MIQKECSERERAWFRARYRRVVSVLPVEILALGLLAALSLLFFWKIALTNQILTGLDLFAYFYPYRDYVSEVLRNGRLPLWNPYLFMGAPLLANSQAAVLYPLYWPLLWLSAPKQIAWSIVVHVWWAGVGTFLYARQILRLRPLIALVPAIAFAFGGFLGAQVEHINQLNSSVWLPWLFLFLEKGINSGQRRTMPVLGGGLAVGLVLLAGHSQAAYIVLVASAANILLKGLLLPKGQRMKMALRGIVTLAFMTLIGLVLAVGQLLPTLELSRLSVRSGGMPYQEAASFSLKPTLVFKALLPPLIWEPPFSEYVAYVGLSGLTLAAIGVWTIVFRSKQPGGEKEQDERILPPGEDDLALVGSKALALALLGLFLAFGAYNPVYYLLYRLVPGFDLFRVPARWLLLYSFGMASLAGTGLESLSRALAASSRPSGIVAFLQRADRRQGLATVLLLLLIVELWIAGRRLNYNHPTAPLAFDSMRTAPAHLLADDSLEPFRFLSISDIRYDPGDLVDLRAMLVPYLSERALYELIVATKMKEVLAFNLPLRYRLFSVDGYDGGLLPLVDYVRLERLFLPESEIWPDGRLRQQLRHIPPARLLSLLNVKYVITDKTQDVWINDVYYDLEYTVPLGEVVLAGLPEFETTHLGLVSYLTDTAELPNGTPVAQISVTNTEGIPISILLRAGEHTAEGLYDAQSVAHRQAQVAHFWNDRQPGVDYVAVLDLRYRLRPTAIAIRSLLPGKVHLRGLTLIDDTTDTSRSVTIDPSFRLVHSGDVKIYQNLQVLPRAFIVHRARIAPNPEEALSLLRDPSFDPTSEVLLEQGSPLAEPKGTSTVQIINYESERVELQVELDTPGYLILTDTYYPGWTANVDGQHTRIQRADLYFRALALEPGSHRVTFCFQPYQTWLGLGVGLASWLGWSLAIALALRTRTGPEHTSSV